MGIGVNGLGNKYKYQVVTQDDVSHIHFKEEIHTKLESMTWRGFCPWISRTKAITAVLFMLLTIIGILYSSTNKTPSVTHNSFLATTVPESTYLRNRSQGDDKIRFMHTKRILPHCLVIGARKAGTRALLTFLDLHPQIRTAKNEVHFFDDDENYELGYEWYRKKMPYSFPGQIVMEKSPAYFTYHYVPKRVHAMNNSIKLLLILRDPVERAISDYLQIHANKVEKEKPDVSFEEHAIQENGEVDKTYPPIKRSIYARHMEHWLEYFSLDQMLLLSGERLVDDPLSQLRKVEDFLNIEHRLTEDMFYLNTTRGFYCLRNDTEERCLAASKGRPHPYIDPLVIQKLQDFYRPMNREFYEMVHHDFGWP